MYDFAKRQLAPAPSLWSPTHVAAIDDTPAKSAPYVGVAWYKQGGTYEAYLSVNAGCEKLGRWATAEEAAIARDIARRDTGA